jgi:hypothetical protein
MNDYPVNNEDSKKYRHLFPILYSHVFPGHTDLHYYPDGSSEQLDDKVDLALCYRGRELQLEEKLISKQYSKFYCETESCSKPGMITDGWMRTSKAHYLVYAFTVPDRGLDIYILKFPEFKEWFWVEMAKRPCPFDWHRNPDKNQSQGRLVSVQWCIRRVPARHYFLSFDGECIDELEGHAA